MSTMSERLVEVAKALPEPLLAEVVDFADFLRARQASVTSQLGDISPAGLCGGLEDTKTFSGSPLAIQQQLRDEWH